MTYLRPADAAIKATNPGSNATAAAFTLAATLNVAEAPGFVLAEHTLGGTIGKSTL